MTTVALGRDEDHALWGVGRIKLSNGVLAYPLSRRDIEADTKWAQDFLGLAGIRRRSHILFVGSGAEWGQSWPYHNAALRLGAVASYVEDSPYDAYRAEMFTRRFRIDAVFGLSANIVRGLKESGHDLSKVFGGVPLVVARPGALAALRAEGLTPWNQIPIGVGYAFQSPGQTRAHYDSSEWLFESIGGALVVTTLLERAFLAARLKTDIVGDVCGEGQERHIVIEPTL